MIRPGHAFLALFIFTGALAGSAGLLRASLFFIIGLNITWVLAGFMISNPGKRRQNQP